MDQKVLTFENVSFDKISLSRNPATLRGSYMTNILYDQSPLFLVQFPSCKTKQGIIRTSGNKCFCELIYPSDNSLIIKWFEELYKTIIDLAYEKRELWFNGESTSKEDLESCFVENIKPYKGGKQYLLKTIVEIDKHNNYKLSCYDENTEPCDINRINVENDVEIIPLLKFVGFEFSSTRMQIKLVLNQVMILAEEELETNNSCLITNKVKHNLPNPKNNESETKDVNLNVEIKKPEEKEILMITNSTQEQEQELLHDQDVDNVNVNNTHINKENTTKEIQNTHDEDDDTICEIITNYEDENLDNLEEITLRTQKDVYIEMWIEARKKAKEAKLAALEAYFNAKQIKLKCGLEDLNLDDSDDEFDEYLESLETDN
jgi:hypothetical protein